MAELVQVAKKDELKNGTMKAVNVAGREVLLARVSDNYYAAENRCPHLGGNLAQGKLEGTVVTCPLHGSQFDLSSGQVIRWTNFTGFAAKLGKLLKSPKSLATYKVKIEGDNILVEV
jgi:3-phenylpropionate/trans-cinnamate dioxygenase ferredoxin subunit